MEFKGLLFWVESEGCGLDVSVFVKKGFQIRLEFAVPASARARKLRSFASMRTPLIFSVTRVCQKLPRAKSREIYPKLSLIGKSLAFLLKYHREQTKENHKLLQKQEPLPNEF